MKREITTYQQSVQQKVKSTKNKPSKGKTKRGPKKSRESERLLSDPEFESVYNSQFTGALALAQWGGIRDSSDAQSVVNEAMMSMRNTKVIEVEEFKKWLMNRVWSRAKSAYRKMKRNQEVLEQYGQHIKQLSKANSHFHNEGFSDEVESMLTRLSDDEQRIIRLQVLDDLSGKEAARILGMNPGTVKSHKSRACEKLRAMYSAWKDGAESGGISIR